MSNLAAELEMLGISWEQAAAIGEWALANYSKVQAFLAALLDVAQQPFFSPQWKQFKPTVDALAPTLDSFPLPGRARVGLEKPLESEDELVAHLERHSERLGAIDPSVILQVVRSLPELIAAVRDLTNFLGGLGQSLQRTRTIHASAAPLRAPRDEAASSG